MRLLQPAASGIAINAIVNGASNLAGAIAPGEVVVLYGSGLGPGTLTQFQLGANGLVPTTVGGTTVYFDSISRPMLYTSSNQVGVIVPFGISGPQVAGLGGIQRPVLRADHRQRRDRRARYLHSGQFRSSGQAAAVNQDGSINGAAKPVKAGDVISLYITGAGQTNPPGADGQPGTGPTGGPVLPVTATVGGASATVQYAGSALGLVAGVIQVNVVVPAGTAAGAAVPVSVQVGTNSTQPNVTIAVSN